MTKPLFSKTPSTTYIRFEEHIKDTIKPDKRVGCMIFSAGFLTMPERKILDTQVSFTSVGGEIA